ncbi:MAG TPA: hypothetical protein VG755_34055 [Nannocystaceae bacterium]|nr:hypothetical protein [Nannocystaceae bacterium]
MPGRTSWMVAAFSLLAGCTVQNLDHCFFREGDKFCEENFPDRPVCNQCTAANNGCVADGEIEADLEEKCHAVTIADTGSTSELTNADSTVTAGTSMSSTTASSMSGDVTTSPTSTTTSADSGTTETEESSSTDPSSSSESTGPTGPVCGDGVMEGTENCDGDDFGEATDCASVNLGTGDLSCTVSCELNVDGCTGMEECGNDLIEGNEQCEGLDLVGETCESLGFVAGALACDRMCNYDVGECESCGNGYVDLDDNCDGSDFNGQTCATFGHAGGMLACDNQCDFDITGCNDCGDGNVDAGEQCDGADFGAHTCATEGFSPSEGDLGCNADCTLDTSDCCYPALHGCATGADCCSGNCGLIGLDLVCL